MLHFCLCRTAYATILSILGTSTFSFSHISFVPGDEADHAIFPIYPHLYMFDYVYGVVPQLHLPLGML
jgi:hypothetical protein